MTGNLPAGLRCKSVASLGGRQRETHREERVFGGPLREVTELSDQLGGKCGLLTSLLQHKPLLKLFVQEV